MAQGSTGYPAPKAAELCGGTDPNGKIQSLQLDANKNLKITGTISASNPSVGSNGQMAPTSSTEVGIIDSGGNLQGVSSSNPLPATVAGVSTAANQATQTTALQAIQAQTVPDFISVNNSSTVVLAGGATFTGVFEDVSQYAEMRVIVYSDQSSATNGLNLQYSSNGTVTDANDFYTITGGAGAQYGAGAGSQYFRVVYTNGSTTQTTFRLQTVYKKFRTKPSSQRQQDGYTNETDLEQVWTFNSVWNGSTWDRLKGDSTNGAYVQIKGGGTAGAPAGAINTIQGVTGGTAVTVSGTFYQATQPVSGTVTVTQSTGTNLHTVIDSGAVTVTNATAANLLATVSIAASQTLATVTTVGSATITPTKGTLTDNSGTTSATPSTATTLMAANSSRKYLLIQNDSTTATIWINFTTTAVATQPSIQLGPLGSLVMETGFVSTELVSVISTTASVPYTAKQA